MNPNIDEDWYDTAYGLGGDDFCDYPPIGEWVDAVLTAKPNARVFTLNITADSMSVIL